MPFWTLRDCCIPRTCLTLFLIVKDLDVGWFKAKNKFQHNSRYIICFFRGVYFYIKIQAPHMFAGSFLATVLILY